MNDREHSSDNPDTAANAGPTSTEAARVTPTFGEIHARREEIAAAIHAPDPSANASVAALVTLFRDDIERARLEGKKWQDIAVALSTSGVTARPDAVRVAYSRLPLRQPQQRPQPSAGPVVAEPLSIAARTPNPARNAIAPSGKPPSLAPRIR